MLQPPCTPCSVLIRLQCTRLIGILGAFIHFSCERDRPWFARVHRNPFIQLCKSHFFSFQARFSILTRFCLRLKTSINHVMSVVLIKHRWSLYFITELRATIVDRADGKYCHFFCAAHVWATKHANRNGTTAIEQRVHMWTMRTFAGTFSWCEPSNELWPSNCTAIVIVLSRFFRYCRKFNGDRLRFGLLGGRKKIRDKLTMTKCKGQNDKQTKKKNVKSIINCSREIHLAEQ